MDTKHYNDIDETVYQFTCDNGLEVFIVSKPGFSKKFVTYSTKYGSMDDHFLVNGKEYLVPDGIAHFLEHKMFEKESGDVFKEFSKNGANANAFTSYDRTSYLFSTTETFKENLKILMNMVEQPYFTPETVEKEVGIIEEEIKMYQDNPDYRLYFETLQLMYQQLPVKKDIAGSIRSINQITADDLYLCHSTFYHPSNMVLIIVGDVDIKDTQQFITTHQNERQLTNEHKIERIFTDEPLQIASSHKSIHLDIKEKKVMLGYKSNSDNLNNKERLVKDVAMLLGLEILFGEQSKFYYEMLKDEIIDDSFSFSHSEELTHSHTLFVSHTQDEQAFSNRISEIVKTAIDEQFITEDKLLLQKREIIGDYLQSLNSPEYIANQFTKYYFDGQHLYEILPVINDISIQDVYRYIKEVLDDQYKVECVIKPNA